MIGLDKFALFCKENGDPYGNRTRVSAVKGLFVMKSMARPAFPVPFYAISLNGLAVRGDG